MKRGSLSYPAISPAMNIVAVAAFPMTQALTPDSMRKAFRRSYPVFPWDLTGCYPPDHCWLTTVRLGKVICQTMHNLA